MSVPLADWTQSLARFFRAASGPNQGKHHAELMEVE
jgi:hypothetical protein